MAWTEKYCNPTGGGAHDGSTPADAWSLVEAIAGAVAGMRMNVLKGSGNTYDAATGTRNFTVPGTVTAPIWWRGYKTTPGDLETNVLAAAGTDMPSWTATTGTYNIPTSHHIFSSIDFSNNATQTPVTIPSGSRMLFYGCRMSNPNTSSTARALTCFTAANNLQFIRCSFASNPAGGTIVAPCRNTAFLGCRVSGAGIGLNLGVVLDVLIGHCIFDSLGGDCITTSTGSCTAWGNSFYGGAGHGFNLTGVPLSLAMCILLNNHFENLNGASKFAVTNSSGTNTNAIIAVGNTNYNCTGVYNGFGDMPQIYDGGTLTGPGFVNGAGHDFTPTAALLAKGFPMLFESTSLVGYMTPGAIQVMASGRVLGRRRRVR